MGHMEGMKKCDEVHVFWDVNSSGSHVDLGMALALEKEIIPVKVFHDNEGKSYWKALNKHVNQPLKQKAKDYLMNKAEKIQQNINELRDELILHQKKCKHPRVVGKYGSNTGHLCEIDDRYWIELDCPTCLKRWYVHLPDDDYYYYQKHMRKG